MRTKLVAINAALSELLDSLCSGLGAFLFVSFEPTLSESWLFIKDSLATKFVSFRHKLFENGLELGL